MLVLVRNLKSVFLVEADRRIDLYHAQGNCFSLLRGVSQQYLKNLRPNALPLHDRRHVERAKIYGCIFNLFLNPANIFAIRGDNPDFVEFEELGKVLSSRSSSHPTKRSMIQRIVSKYTARAKTKSALQAARNLMSTGFRPACKMYSGRQQVFNYTVKRRIERGLCQCLIGCVTGQVT